MDYIRKVNIETYTPPKPIVQTLLHKKSSKGIWQKRYFYLYIEDNKLYLDYYHNNHYTILDLSYLTEIRSFKNKNGKFELIFKDYSYILKSKNYDCSTLWINQIIYNLNKCSMTENSESIQLVIWSITNSSTDNLSLNIIILLEIQ